MTIRERFEKYSTEEIESGINTLRQKLEESEQRLAEFRAEGNVEFYKVEKMNNEDIFQKLLDAEAALVGRK